MSSLGVRLGVCRDCRSWASATQMPTCPHVRVWLVWPLKPRPLRKGIAVPSSTSPERGRSVFSLGNRPLSTSEGLTLAEVLGPHRRVLALPPSTDGLQRIFPRFESGSKALFKQKVILRGCLLVIPSLKLNSWGVLQGACGVSMATVA